MTHVQRYLFPLVSRVRNNTLIIEYVLQHLEVKRPEARGLQDSQSAIVESEEAQGWGDPQHPIPQRRGIHQCRSPGSSHL